MIRRARAGRRGVTLIEFLAASSIATVVGGAMILLMTGMRQAYEAHTTFQQLSGYLEVASTTLRNDIWGATGASPTVGTGVCPSRWLELTNPATTVVYCIDDATAGNKKLRRTVTSPPGAAWNVAQFVLTGANTSAVIDNPAAPRLITINLQLSRTVNGRQYIRQISNLAYRTQVQP